MRRYLAGQRRRVLVLAALVLGGIVLQVLSPLLIARFIDEALSGADQTVLTRLAIIFIAAAVATQILTIFATYFSEKVGWTATNGLRADLAEHCLRLDMSFHKTKTPGEMITRLDGDIDALSLFFSQFVIHVLANFLLMVAIMTVLTLEDWRLGLAVSFFAAGALIFLIQLRHFALPAWLRMRERQAMFYGFLGEQLSGREDIRGNGARGHSMNQLRRHYRELLPLEIESILRGVGTTSAGTHILFTGARVGLVILAYMLWQNAAISLGTIYVAFHYTEMLRRPMDRIREQLNSLQAAGASIIRVQGLLDTQTELPDTGQTPLPDGPLSVDVENVTFGYAADDPVLQDVSLRLAPGEVLGLLGRTGGGKTTIARLLVRLYDIDAGSVRIGGVEVRETPLADLRSRVAVVSQDVQVFEGTVRENLTLFDPSRPDAELEAALRGLGLERWLERLGDGLDSHIGPSRLSAGEAQLLSCARAFLRDPGLVLLDEATSRLDPATQRLVDDAMDRLLQGRTAVIIAHRLATIDRADTIAVIEDGRIAEYGAYRDLIADPGSRFSRLHRMDVEVQAV